MSKRLILLPQVVEQLREEYHDKHAAPGETFMGYVQRELNPGGRGLLTTKISDEPVRIKVWGELFSLSCVEASEAESIKAVNVRPMKEFQYAYVLEAGYPIQGPWEIVEANDTLRNSGKYHAYGAGDEGLTEELEGIQNDQLQKKQFVEFEAYWNGLDLVNQMAGDTLREKKLGSLGEYTEFRIDYDQNRIALLLKAGAPAYRTDARIRLCSKQDWLKQADLASPNLDKIHSMAVGSVLKYDRRNRRLVIELFNEDVMRKLSQSKEFKEGRLWIDDAGTRSILTRQRQALRRLFERKTANPALHDFIPEVANLKSRPRMEWDVHLFADRFHSLTHAQREAVSGALSGNDLFLIQGPPGTGKTTVISAIVQFLVQNRQRVLLSSQTNLAVDNVLQRIGKEPGVQAIRIGSEDNIELDCMEYSLTNRVEHTQQDIIAKLKERDTEISALKERLASLLAKRDMHARMAAKANSIQNVLSNRIEYKTEMEAVRSKLEVLRTSLERQVEVQERFEQQHGDCEKQFESLILVMKPSEISENEGLRQSAYFAEHLDLTASDRYDISTYMDLIDAIDQCLVEEKRLSDQLSDLNLEKSRIDVQQASLEQQIQSLQYAGNGGIGQLVEKHEMLSLDLKTLFHQSIGITRKQDEISEEIYSLQEAALALKEKIEACILSYRSIWQQIFGIESISKGQFISIVRDLDEFQERFSSLSASWHLFEHMEQYAGYKHAVNELIPIRRSLSEEELRFDKLTYKIRALEEKCQEYREDPLLQQYMKEYELELDQIDAKSEAGRIQEFERQFNGAEARLSLLERTASLAMEWREQLQYYQPCFDDLYLQTSNMVCATCLGISSNQNNYFLETEFDYVIIDEAARSTALELLIPMIRGEHIILVGDHKQISPQLDREILKRIENDQQLSEEEMDKMYKQSLFGLMYERADHSIKSFLNEQFRMNEHISNVVSAYFYQNELKDNVIAQHKRHSLEHLLQQGFYWINTPYLGKYQEEENDFSYHNAGEAEDVFSILNWLNDNLKVSKSVGIIAPYTSQRMLIEERFSEHRRNYNWLDIEINTIDAFQGREKNVIILSLVRNNPNHSIGHIGNYARANVALSRAQELLFVIGSAQFIQENRRKAAKWNDVYHHLQKKQAVLAPAFFSDQGGR